MTEVFLADEAMQDERVACQYFIPAGEDVWNFAGLHCSMLPWAQRLLAEDPTCFAVQRVSFTVTETWEHRSDLTSLFSTLFLRRHGGCTEPGAPAWIVLMLMERWSQPAEDLPLGQHLVLSNI